MYTHAQAHCTKIWIYKYMSIGTDIIYVYTDDMNTHTVIPASYSEVVME